jgi:hypothetical protein
MQAEATSRLSSVLRGSACSAPLRYLFLSDGLLSILAANRPSQNVPRNIRAAYK